jgi:hypothetical protein
MAEDERGNPGWRRPERVDMPTGAIPFEEHVPYTASELGLELGQGSGGSRRRMVVVAVIAVAAAVAVAVLISRGSTTTLADLPPRACYSPAVEDAQASVHRKACSERHQAQLVGLFAATSASGGAYPGASELALFGDGACRTEAEHQAGRTLDALEAGGTILRIAVPDEPSWSKGDRDVACSFVRQGAADLTKPVG